MKKSLINRIKIAAVCFCLCCILFVSACNDNKYPNISNDVDGYYVQTIALKSGEEYTFNVREIFKDCGIAIEKYKIETGSVGNYTVKGDTITAVGTGVSSVVVTLYSLTDHTRYVCSLATLYTYDEKDFTSISTASDLQGIADLDGKYILAADIDLGGIENWEPIGNFPADNAFTGMFITPNGYKIKNLTITSAADIFHGPYGGCCGGLFGSINGAFLYGINLEDVNIDVSDFDGNSYSKAGGIAAETSNAYIKDCTVTGNVKAIGRAGGIAGSVNWGCIENCTFSGKVTACEALSQSAMTDDATGAGGIAGFIGIPYYLQPYKYGLVGCSAKGEITADKNAGGIAGYIWGLDFVKDYSFVGGVKSPYSPPISLDNHYFGKIQEKNYN